MSYHQSSLVQIKWNININIHYNTKKIGSVDVKITHSILQTAYDSYVKGTGTST